MCTLIRGRDGKRLYYSGKNDHALRCKRVKIGTMTKPKPKRTTLTHSACSKNMQYLLDIHKSSWTKNSFAYCDSKANTETNSSSRTHNSCVIKPSKLTSFSSLSGPTSHTNGDQLENPTIDKFRDNSTELQMHTFGKEVSSLESEIQPTPHNSMAAINTTARVNGTLDLTNNTTSVRSVATNTLHKMAVSTAASAMARPPPTPKFVFLKSGGKSTKTEEVRFVNGFQYDNGIRLKNRDDFGSSDDSDSDISTFEIDSNISSISTVVSSNSDSSSCCSSDYSDSECSDTDSTSSSSSSSDSDSSIGKTRYRTKLSQQFQQGYLKVDSPNISEQQPNSTFLFKIPDGDKFWTKNKGKFSQGLSISTTQGIAKNSPKSPVSPPTNSIILKKREEKWTVQTCSLNKTEALTKIVFSKTASRSLSPNLPENMSADIRLNAKTRFEISEENTKLIQRSGHKLRKKHTHKQLVHPECEKKCVNGGKFRKLKNRTTKFNGEKSSTKRKCRIKESSPSRKKRRLGRVPNEKQTSVVVSSQRKKRKIQSDDNRRRETQAKLPFDHSTADINDNVIDHTRACGRNKEVATARKNKIKLTSVNKKQYVSSTKSPRKEKRKLAKITCKDGDTVRTTATDSKCTPKKKKVPTATLR